jgi:hypothetical protein
MNLIASSYKWGPIAVLILLLTAGMTQATAQARQPNILVIMGDDIVCGTSAPTTAA